MKRTISFLLSLLIFSFAYAQTTPTQKLNLSGYIQTQYQWGEGDATLNVGAGNDSYRNSFNRIGIRRGRLKVAYDEGIATGVFQVDITEKGIGVKDAYISISSPWIPSNALRAGVFNRPFGYEISNSSSRRESPERSKVFQTLFPDERDMGAMITLQPHSDSFFHFLKLKAGLFAGNGISQETDSRKDFIGQIIANTVIANSIRFDLGFSYYNGGVYQGTENVYTMSGKQFMLSQDELNIGQYAKREYFGIDIQVSKPTLFGITKLNSEVLFGTQPGSQLNSRSPNSSTLSKHDTYIRNFIGGYLMFVQHISTSPLAIVAKYDWYDPNTKLSGNEIGLHNSHQGDIKYNTLGMGLLWVINDNIRMQAYYDWVRNEKSEHINNYTYNVKDDHFTVRLQYKF